MVKSSCMKPWCLEEISRNVHLIRFMPAKEWWALLLTDAHWDHPLCNRDLLKKHFDAAKQRNAAIISAGDWFCAIQGKWDVRSNKSSLRPELQCDDYLDALVRQSADWLLPYRDNLVLFGDGNHETGIKKRHETDLIDRLCFCLREKGSNVKHGGFSGWLRCAFSAKGTPQRDTADIYYHHGSGGDPAVTKGMIEHERMAAWMRADIVLTGHIHQSNYTRTRCVELSQSMKVVQKTIHWIRSGTYKDEWQDGAEGYHVERNRGPRQLGGWFIRFYLKNHEVKFEVIAAD